MAFRRLGSDIDRPKLFQRQSWPVVKGFLAQLGDSTNPLKMTLLADRFAQLGSKAARVDDRVIRLAHVLTRCPALNMQGAGTMAALAADGFSLSKGLGIAIAGIRHGIYAVGMTEQTLHLNGPI